MGTKSKNATLSTCIEHPIGVLFFVGVDEGFIHSYAVMRERETKEKKGKRKLSKR